MKQFENKVLFIKDEAMKNEVHVLIQNAGKKVDQFFYMYCGGDSSDYLYHEHHIDENEFSLGPKFQDDQEITLDEFKELLKIK